VEASDRPGLLYDILKSLTDCGLNITQAVINTVDGVAHDAFQVTGPEGERVLDVTQQEQVRSAVTAAIAG
jgi:[protein-PII] uridylyltransferase